MPYKFTYLFCLLLLGGETVTALDLRSWDRWFDPWSGRNQVVTTWIGDCL